MVKGCEDNDLVLNKRESLNSLIVPDIDIPYVKPKINLGILASGNGSNFEAVVKSSRENKLNANINLLIVNNKNCGAIERAKRLAIKYEYLDHRDFSSREKYDIELIKIFNSANVEAIAMAGWMRIVTSTLIDNYPERIINIHPSLLPNFKGINAIDQALNAGVKITGCTAHIVEKDVDAGEIICQAAVKIDKNDNTETLRRKIQSYEHRIFPLAISLAAINWRINTKDNMDI
tara:strand:- start:20834 stop:21532 length:699 start_codon:yes stop_codon:yes gene_type:complete